MRTLSPNLRQRVSLLLIAIEVSLPLRSWAAEDPNKDLKAIHESLKSSYPSLIQNSYSALVEGYFVQRLLDYRLSFQYTSDRLKESRDRYPQLIERLGTSRTALQRYTARFQEDLSSFKDLKSALLYEKEIVEQNIIDFTLLQQIWANRCSHLEGIVEKFIPYQYFAPDVVDQMTQPDRPVTLEFSISSSGMVTGSVGAAGANVERTTGTAAVSSLAAAGSTPLLAGKALTLSSFGPGASISMAGGFVGLGVAAAMSLVFLAIDQGEIARINNEASSLRDKIYRLQKDAIQEQVNSASSLIQSQCTEILAGDLEQQISEQIRFAQTYLGEISDQTVQNENTEEGLKQAYSDHFRYLEETYFPRVRAHHLARMNAHFADLRQKRSGLNSFIRGQIAPLLSQFQRNNQELFIMNLSLKQNLWSEMIKGDAFFHEGENFYLGIPGSWSSSRMKGKWDIFLEQFSPSLAL